MPSSDDKREKLAKRQANAAVALLRMNQPEKVWPLLKHSPDPRVRSYLIHRLGPLGADAEAIVKRSGRGTGHHDSPGVAPEPGGVQREGTFRPTTAKPCCRSCRTIYRTEPIRAFMRRRNGCCGQWKQEAWLKQVNEEWAKDKEQRAKRLEGIQQLVERRTRRRRRRSGTSTVRARRWW